MWWSNKYLIIVSTLENGIFTICYCNNLLLDRVKRIWYLSPMRAAKVQASLRIRAVSPEPSLLAHTSSESRGTFRQKARSLAPLNGWACAVKICHDGMLEDTNSLDGAHILLVLLKVCFKNKVPFNLLVNMSHVIKKICLRDCATRLDSNRLLSYKS